MSECICSSCKYLKSVINENDIKGNSINEECEFGFPSDDCEACELDGCELTCDHYEEEKSEELSVVRQCAKCGVALKNITNKMEYDEVFCVSCYLARD